MTAPMDFFWRDIQTVKGAIRAALALPHVDIGELREVERSNAFTVPEASNDRSGGVSQPYHSHERVTIRMARESRTRSWHANPPSIAELFALPILSRVAL